MLRDYLYQISNIIYNNQTSGNRFVNNKNRAGTGEEINQIIKANNIVLKMFNQSAYIPKKYTHQHGSGLSELGDSIDDFSGVNDKLKNLLERMKGEVDDSSTNKRKTNISNEIKEISEVAIVLIKFLGELIDLNQDESLKKVQQQVADIVLGLEKYLA